MLLTPQFQHSSVRYLNQKCNHIHEIEKIEHLPPMQSGTLISGNESMI